MEKYPKVEVKEIGDSVIIVIPKSLLDEKVFEESKEYEAIIAPRESFKKGFKVSKDILQSKDKQKDGLSSFESSDPSIAQR